MKDNLLVNQIEGIDLEGHEALLVSTEKKGDKLLITLYFPELNTLKNYSLPKSSKITLEEAPDYEIPSSAVDMLRLDSPNRDQLPIRNTLPDSYFPPDPNYPNTLVDILYQPTMRRTIGPRFYNFQKGGKMSSTSSKFIRRQRHRASIEFDDMTQYKPEGNPNENIYPDGSPERPKRYNYPMDPYHDVNKDIWPEPDPKLFSGKVTKKLKDLAKDFWQQYQDMRYTKLPSEPGMGGRSGLQLEDFAVIFQKDYELDSPDMEDLLMFMCAIRWIDYVAVLGWKDRLKRNELNPVRTPRYYHRRNDHPEPVDIPVDEVDVEKVASSILRSDEIKKANQKIVRAKAFNVSPEGMLEFVLANLTDVNGTIININDARAEIVEGGAKGKSSTAYLQFLDTLKDRCLSMRDLLIKELEKFAGKSEVVD